MWQLLVVVVMTMVFFGAQDLVSRSRLPVLWTLFLFVPLALTPYWLKTNSFDLFVWIKIYSVMFCVSWASWLRFTPMGDKPWLRLTIAWLLVANILEALVLDIQGGGIAHGFNALAGILLIATLPFSVRHTLVDRTSQHQTLRYNVPFVWICGYTFWNWTFVYLNYPAFTGHHTAILSAALIVAWFDPQRWLQARAATLGLNLLLMATSNAGTLAVSNTTNWFNESIATVAASFALAWMTIHAASTLKSNFVIERPLRISQALKEHLESAKTEWQHTDSAIFSWSVN
ncbi:DUF5692 family protein [Bythopirellula polymerisocia]|uniref:Uncharacterized protein n=1 Tax=Bythopirellula polymerisocia TaxID=2528003 RepID=A0A5C6CJT1_9BACT|nr:DUF5692 family protein [Bythopirellula polymerisocia]TWU24718.1 hypothetical protein Pla144_36040 [Bythopirellula polymerisocia]